MMIAGEDVEELKKNRLLDFHKYIDAFCHEQQTALRLNLNDGMDEKSPVIESYKLLGFAPQELANMGHTQFRCAMCRTLVPMNQIAQNMGYKIWKTDSAN